MKFSRLVALITLLQREFGPVPDELSTVLQEDCCGEGALTSGVRAFNLPAGRRDAAGMQVEAFMQERT